MNDTGSALAAACDIVLPMAAGPELSVAATKTFVASLGAVLHLVAAWTNDTALAAALDRLPDRLTAALDLDWSAALDALSASNSLVTIGRGPTLGHRARSLAQAEGDLQPACRGLQRRGIPARPGRSGAPRSIRS